MSVVAPFRRVAGALPVEVEALDVVGGAGAAEHDVLQLRDESLPIGGAGNDRLPSRVCLAVRHFEHAQVHLETDRSRLRTDRIEFVLIRCARECQIAACVWPKAAEVQHVGYVRV